MDPPDKVSSRTLSPARPPSVFPLRSFSSQWLLIPQGTGILAVILHQHEYQFPGLSIISYVLWLLTIVLLLLSTLLYAVRCILFPQHVVDALRHGPGEIDGLASISIAFTSILQMAAVTLVQGWSPRWGLVVYILWWVNVALAVLAVAFIPFVYVRLYPPGLSTLSPVTQLPFIAALTVAAGAGTICQYGALDAALQIPAIVVSYLLIGASLPLALALDTLFLARLMDKSAEQPGMAFQDMILCGPWGQGSFALQGLGQAVVKGAFAEYAAGMFLTVDAAAPVGFASVFAGLLAWGLASFWWVFAVLSLGKAAVQTRWRFGGSYGLVAWSIVFPWGVYTNAAVQLSKLLDSAAFRAWSAVLTIALVIAWLTNVILTIRGLVKGTLLGVDRESRSRRSEG